MMTHTNNDHDLNARNYPLLAFLQAEELQHIQSVAELRHIEADQHVIEEGKDNHFLYFVQSGTLRVSKQHHHTVFEIGSITPGQVFGEASILYHTTAGASIHSSEACELYQVDIQHMQNILYTNLRFSHAIHQLAEQRSAATALAVNPVFSTLPQAIREVILYNARYIDLEKGDTLFHEGGDDVDFIYLILRGSAEVSIEHPTEAQQTIVFANLVAGDEIGELPLLTHKPHAATVTATSDMRLMQIRASSIQSWMERYSDFETALRQGIQSKLQHNLEALRQSTPSV